MAQVTHLSLNTYHRKTQLNACSRAGRDASITIALFRDVDEKESGISKMSLERSS